MNADLNHPTPEYRELESEDERLELGKKLASSSVLDFSFTISRLSTPADPGRLSPDDSGSTLSGYSCCCHS